MLSLQRIYVKIFLFFIHRIKGLYSFYAYGLLRLSSVEFVISFTALGANGMTAGYFDNSIFEDCSCIVNGCHHNCFAFYCAFFFVTSFRPIDVIFRLKTG